MDRFATHQVKAITTAVDGGDRGRFQALVSVFGNVDLYGDRMVRGAFTRTLREDGLPPIVWSHDWQIPPIGATLGATEESDGLVVDGQLFVGDVALADHVYTAMTRKGGDGRPPLREWSFGYDVRAYRAVEDDDSNALDGIVRELLDVVLHEVGPCLKGVNPRTDLLAIKGVAVPAHLRRDAQDARAESAASRLGRDALDTYVAALTGRR